MNNRAFKEIVVGCYTRLSRAVIVYFAIFLTAFYFTFVLNWLDTRESWRVATACGNILDVRRQVDSLLTVYRDSTTVMNELVVQKDHYLDYVDKELASKQAKVTGPKKEDPDLLLYRATVDRLMEFYGESSDGLKEWQLERYASLEHAVYTWKRLHSSSELSFAQKRERLTRLAREWVGQSIMFSNSGPANDLAAADHLFSIPAVLNQALSRFNDKYHAKPIIADLKFDAAVLQNRKPVETLADVKELEKELQTRQHDLQVQTRSQTFSVPYLGVSMRRSAIFITSLFATLIVIAYALRQVIQLRALIGHAFTKTEWKKEHLREAIEEAVWTSHFFPLLHHVSRDYRAFPSQGRYATIQNVGKAVTQVAWSVAAISELTFIIFFLAVPFGYVWLGNRFNGDAVDGGGLIVDLCLFATVALVLLLSATIALVEITITKHK